MYTEKNRGLKIMSWRNLSLKGRLEREPGKANKEAKIPWEAGLLREKSCRVVDSGL